MASVKVKFRPSTIEGKEGSIYYQIIQNRVIRQLKTDYRIFTVEWDETENCIIVGSSERSNLILSLKERMEWDLKRLDMIIHQLDNRKAGYTADDIVASFQSNTEGQSLFNFMQGIIVRLKQMGKIRTAENYSCTLKSFMQFRGNRDVLLSEIDSDLMQLYEASFYTRGMSFIDMAHLKKKDLQNGFLSYRRRKTGQQLVIRWEKCMQEIIDKYPDCHTDYLLPVIRRHEKGQSQYRNALRLINNKLKEIAVLAGLQTNLTMYVSRHSWASIAKSKNIPLSVISEGMGHDSEATTQIYLASLDSAMIDKANRTILKEL